MTPEQYFRKHGGSRIEDLNHEELLVFAVKFMDLISQTSVRTLLSGAYGEPIDPLPDETDEAIIEAYNTGRSLCVSYLDAEGVIEDDLTDLGTPGFLISVEDRSELLKSLEEDLASRPMRKVYIASSWRNPYYPEVARTLREAGLEVYDFRNPGKTSSGFRWTDIDENAPNWNFKQYKEGLRDMKAIRQFRDNRGTLNEADACVLVLPCGRGAHLEAGWMAGRGKPVIAYIPEMQGPELMYLLFDNIVDSLPSLLHSLGARTDEFTTEMHWEMMEDEVDRQEFLAWAAYGAIMRGATKAEALAKYNISEEFYDQVWAREQEEIDSLPDDPDDLEEDDPDESEEIVLNKAPEKPYKAPDGTTYPSYQAYCNDPNLDSDIIQCKLWSGERTPQNDFERRLLNEIEAAKAAGKCLEIYPE